MNRILINICSDKLLASKKYYTKLLDFEVDFDSDWFVHLISKDKKMELGIIDRTNDIVPKDFQTNPSGFYITFVVDNVDEIYKIAEAEKFEIIKKPEETFYGQRRLLLKDPNGALIDISAPIKDFFSPSEET